MKYGWLPDFPDHRDQISNVTHISLPARVDLRDKCPPVYDQGALGSCTANAIAAAIQYSRRHQCFTDDFVPSRLFIYYNERRIEGTVPVDCGAMIRDGIKSVGRHGDCPEFMWPYDIATFKDSPVPSCYVEALKYRAVDYWRVPRDLVQMRGALAVGFPFVFGFSVYSSFESADVARDGVVPMPAGNEQLQGGHAVMAVGYDDRNKWFIVRNSWGEGWGDKGYFYLPYAFLLNENLSDDFWTVKVVAS